jgi:hypothetical protein
MLLAWSLPSPQKPPLLSFPIGLFRNWGCPQNLHLPIRNRAGPFFTSNYRTVNLTGF